MEEEEKKIRHTISAEETFTLAKDVFDIRTFVKNVYANRAIIRRRINIITLCVSALFTLLYVSYIIFSSLYGKLSVSGDVLVYSLAAAYAFVAIILIIFVSLSSRTSAKHIKKLNFALKIFRLTVRILSIAISIAAIAISMANDASANVALDIVIIIFSVITMVVQVIPLFFGGIAKFVRWLLSPVKVKMRFSMVVLEWYHLAETGKPPKGSSRKISKKYYESIGELIDETLIPVFGKKYINTIKPDQLLELVENSDEASRPVLEGVLKSVFAYAAECGYIVFDPCRDLNFAGTVEEEKKKTMKERFLGIGAKLGKKALDKYLATTSDDDDD